MPGIGKTEPRVGETILPRIPARIDTRATTVGRGCKIWGEARRRAPLANGILKLPEAQVISIIIPTLNEERSLPPLLDAIRRQRAAHEVIVVDGSSQDRTPEVARNSGVRTPSPARVAAPGSLLALRHLGLGISDDVLFFLHVDSTLPPGALERINEVLSTGANINGGNFRLVFDGDTNFSRWLTGFCAWIRLLRFYYGDFGIFLRRSIYEALGGFRLIPVMEDWDFVRRLEWFGQTCCIQDPPSSHRYGASRGDILWRSSTGGLGYMCCIASAYHPTG